MSDSEDAQDAALESAESETDSLEKDMAYRDKVENAMVAVSLAEGGDFDAAQDVLNEKDLLAEHKL